MSDLVRISKVIKRMDLHRLLSELAVGACDTCGRKTWDAREIDHACMTPDLATKTFCHGTMMDTRGVGK